MILFFGPPGSGKSVQGQLLVQRNGWNWLSTGELFRNSKDPEVLARLATGELIDDAMTNEVLDTALRAIKDKAYVVLDGYPRNTEQAAWLDEHLPQQGREIKAVIVFEVSEEELVRRLSGRGRDEDKPEVIKHRLDIYYRQTKPVVEFYERLGVPVCRVDGHGSIEEVHERIQQAVEAQNLTA
ncbi:MAG TPA: nucleoside monophosphate kinase [Candidatus Saccharimonadales bacterium]|nr:nucleoside monophosphate kinase [Candidatus Saccharimonadales bacterium]